jgi:hypothetical protein
MRRLGVRRRDLFFELDRPALKPLPGELMKTPTGGARGWNTISISMGTTIRCRVGWSASSSTPGSRLKPSSCAARESMSPRMVEDQTGHYTAAKECFDGYRKRRASREGMRPSFKLA